MDSGRSWPRREFRVFGVETDFRDPSASVGEPATLALVALGLLPAVWACRRKKRHSVLLAVQVRQ